VSFRLVGRLNHYALVTQVRESLSVSSNTAKEHCVSQIEVIRFCDVHEVCV
jgi:hypothetical protein